MGWKPIQRAVPLKDACPPNGIAVSRRNMRNPRTKLPMPCLLIRVGADLGRSLNFAKEQPVALLLGSEVDAGKMAIVVDPAGPYRAKRQAGGTWWINLGSSDIDGLFNVPTAPFSLARVETHRPENGTHWRAVFKLSTEMLAIRSAA